MKVISLKEAKDAGLKYYFTGKPCKHGHVAERYVPCRECVVCREERPKNNKKKLAKYKREWYLANKEKIAERTQAYRDGRKSETKKYNAKYRVAHREKMRRHNRRYARNNRGKLTAKTQMYRLCKDLRTPAWANKKKIERIYMLANWASKFTDEPLEVDHIIPLQGERISGLHVENNLQIISRSENRAKSNAYAG